jgi:hypothetical protein
MHRARPCTTKRKFLFYVRSWKTCSPSRRLPVAGPPRASEVKSPDFVGGLEPRASEAEHGEAPPFDRSEHGGTIASGEKVKSSQCTGPGGVVFVSRSMALAIQRQVAAPSGSPATSS